MRFDCGKTREEKIKYLSDWHPFFPIIPRRTGPRKCRWLETIERRGELVTHWVNPDQGIKVWVWEYRPITFPPLTEKQQRDLRSGFGWRTKAGQWMPYPGKPRRQK